MNKCILLGNIAQDLELKQTPNGHAVINFSMATNNKIKQGEEWVDKAEFHNITAWGKTAESIARFFQKGSKLLVEGRLETRSWEDKEGNKRYKVEIVLQNFEFTGPKQESQATPGKIESDSEFAKKVKQQDQDISVEDIPF